MFQRAAVVAVSCGVLLAGCGRGASGTTDEVISNLIEAGFPAEGIRVADGAVYVGGDAHVSLEASREMLDPGEGSHELHRTTNIVGPNVTTICVNPTATFRSHSRLMQGLELALANYNALGLRIRFIQGATASCHAMITAATMTGAGGSAGYPSNGLPYGRIYIGTGLSSYSLDRVEHVITHELGHTIGLRHTDFYNPSISCGTTGPGPEGVGTVGAIQIPGTPPPTPGGSLMNTCIPPDTDGEFTPSDIVGLNFIY
ncbi:M57 family metalloprotease [Corallococcus macrosporus]|uniref:M27 family peptidase n=1 Tax=Myxococcus fulvus (strain ATCC BAA-855 / HW-1) TaxID=483219 RepID=F8CGG3_MYXFH|nr:M57 family metalloprotease [Corallococcus macrosporus]AEI68698.1 M27 family peptidase [Corallococcus macrosporus]